MQFTITEDVFSAAPGLLVGMIVCKEIINPPSPPEIVAMLRTTENNIRVTIPDTDALKRHPNIVRPASGASRVSKQARSMLSSCSAV